jgi:hypothetical protein
MPSFTTFHYILNDEQQIQRPKNTTDRTKILRRNSKQIMEGAGVKFPTLLKGRTQRKMTGSEQMSDCNDLLKFCVFES